MKDQTARRSENNFFLRASFSRLSESPDYFSFFVGLIRSSKVFQLWERWIKYFRRFRLVTTALRLLPWILLLISTHTILYAAVVASALLAPIIAVAVLSLLAEAPLRYREANPRMARKIEGKTVYVIFPERSREFESGAFWRANLLDLSTKESSIVVVVSPYLFSSRGVFETRRYLHLREERDNLFLVRRHYYFSLRKHVLTKKAKRLILIY